MAVDRRLQNIDDKLMVVRQAREDLERLEKALLTERAALASDAVGRGLVPGVSAAEAEGAIRRVQDILRRFR